MQIGTIVKRYGQVGVVTGEPQPSGKIPCYFGNEVQRITIAVKPSELTEVELIDLTYAENERVVALLQALVFRLVDDKIPF